MGRETMNIFRLLAECEREDGDEDSEVITVNGIVIKRLHEEVVNFANHISPSVLEVDMRRAIIAHMTEVILKIFPACQVDAYGSSATELYLPTSNIDLVVSGVVVDAEQLDALVEHFERTVSAPGRVRCVTCRKVTAVSLTEKVSGLQIDVTFDDPDGKLEHLRLVRDAQDTHAELRPLLLVLKTFLRHRTSHDVFTGGLSSHTLVLMLISFLQLYPVSKSCELLAEKSIDGASLGVRLMQFLRLYGVDFDYANALSIREDGFVFPKASRGWLSRDNPTALAVEDPVTLEDTAEGTFNYAYIRTEFANAYRGLWEMCFSNVPPKEATVLSGVVFPRLYNVMHDQRLEITRRWVLVHQPADSSRQEGRGRGGKARKAARGHDDEDSDGQGRRGGTTVMMRNLPNKYNQLTLLEDIDKECKGMYDFFYLPIDFKNECNLGYAFINFVSEGAVDEFTKKFSGRKWDRYNSHKICVISRAKIQGKDQLIEHFQNSSVMAEDECFRPLIWYSSGPMKGLAEPFPVGPNVRPRPRKAPHAHDRPMRASLAQYIRKSRPRVGRKGSGSAQDSSAAPSDGPAEAFDEGEDGEPVEWHLEEAYPPLRRKNSHSKRPKGPVVA